MNYYDKFRKLHSEADDLINNNKKPNTSEFQKWFNSCLTFISRKYGENSIEMKHFSSIKFMPAVWMSDSELIKQCKIGIETAKGMLEQYIEDSENENFAPKENRTFSNEKVFIVHGHDDNLKNSVARLLEKQGIEAIILHEKVNQSDTIIEKVEHYGNSVGAAVILFTPDDEGKSNSEKEYKSRARQNVVFEAGYFMGFLGRRRIIVLVSDSSIELPGDLNGVVYISDMWQFKLLQELKAMGFNIDMNKIVV